MKAICSITLFLLISSLQLNSTTEIQMNCRADDAWRVLTYTILSDEKKQGVTAFKALHNQSKSILFLSISGNTLSLVCHIEITNKHIEDYASKFQIRLRLDSEEIKDKKAIPEFKDQTKLFAPRSISRERFEALPAVKQKHILDNPDKYTITE